MNGCAEKLEKESRSVPSPSFSATVVHCSLLSLISATSMMAIMSYILREIVQDLSDVGGRGTYTGFVLSVPANRHPECCCCRAAKRSVTARKPSAQLRRCDVGPRMLCKRLLHDECGIYLPSGGQENTLGLKRYSGKSREDLSMRPPSLRHSSALYGNFYHQTELQGLSWSRRRGRPLAFDFEELILVFQSIPERRI